MLLRNEGNISVTDVRRKDTSLIKSSHNCSNIISNPIPCRQVKLYVESSWPWRGIELHFSESLQDLLLIWDSVSIIIGNGRELRSRVGPASIGVRRRKNKPEIVDKRVSNLMRFKMNDIILIFNGYNCVSFPFFQNRMVKIFCIPVSTLDLMLLCSLLIELSKFREVLFIPCSKSSL